MIETRLALPQRSPQPLIVPCTWRAPTSTAASELATPHSASLWQWMPTRVTPPISATAAAVAAEEVLGVVDDALAGADEEGDRLLDHAQVLVAVDLDDLLEMQHPGLAD